eukprot:3223319-Alexandrium_andersonii.AAC.1
MSASLVGSEMCIRDRSTIHLARGAQGQAARGVRSIQRRPASEHWWLAELQAATASSRVLRQSSREDGARAT